MKTSFFAAPVIIGGFYRSGTSLLRRLFDSHPNFYCGPEVKFFKDFYGDYLSDPLSHARFFSSARSMGLKEGCLLEIFGRSFIECHEEAAKKYGKKRWADKNPENVLYLKQWDLLLKKQYVFVHVVRNPQDALASLNEIGFEKALPKSFSSRIGIYDQFLTAANNFQQQESERSITIRYEDLVGQPDATMRQLFYRLGEPFHGEIFDKFHLPERNRGLEDPKISQTNQIHTKGVGRWKNDLDKQLQREVRSKLGSWIALYGYGE